MKYDEDKRISACIFYNGNIYEDDTHFGAYIYYLKCNLDEKTFKILEDNDFSDIDVYEDDEVSYGEIQKINNEFCIIFYNMNKENDKILKKYNNKFYLLNYNSDELEILKK